ncbi:mandelate racemase/muconate lactonizing enzyme family protein [Budvicia aquatica]|uniref:L-rhamnonate dehydratase n=1 Tax=Budvicia aquatica TaxID=82979 RepID=A0A2C6DKV7_9GAMM|nr:mandelate racemase/muconate lactonizing enzyme family protein [Budvicia aquatica]PHI29837.1 mandelate racemase/muconate lactonizing enzyme family protein [Budvicia aquatica]VFS48432.1 L-rhamnonate dehydratase [Budvicia aquatica]
MKITAINTWVLVDKLPERFGMSQWFWDTRSICVVEVQTDEGISGWGECFGPAQANAALIKELFAPLLNGENPLQRRYIWETMYNRTREFGRKGIAITALSGIDIALWDIFGKVVGKPIAELLGGNADKPIKAYASSFYYSPVDDLRQIEKDAASALSEGYCDFKMKVGGVTLNEDVRRVARVRELIGPDASLAVDANRAYTVHEALRFAESIEEYQISWFEEPILPDDFDGYSRLKKQLPMKIAGGESEFTRFGFRNFLEGNCVDIVQPDVAACGGISEALNIAAMATAYGVECYPHQWGSSISLAATLHLMSAIPAAVPRLAKVPALLELDRAPNIFREQLTDLAPAPTMAVPNGPGLGINVDLDMLNHYSLR